MNLKSFYQTNRLRFVLIIFLSLMNPVAIITASYLNMWQLTALHTHDSRAWLVILLVTLLAYLLSYFFDMGSDNLLARQVQEFNGRLRKKIVNHVCRDQRDYQVSEVENRLTNDLNTVNDQYFNLIPLICNFTGYTAFTAIALLTMHWSLLFLTLVSIAVSILLPKVMDKPIQKATEKLSSQNKQYLDLIEKWLSGIAELERYLAGEKLFNVMHKGAKDLERANLNLTKKQQILAIITGSASQIMVIVLYVWTGILINKGSVTFGAVGVIGSFSTYISFGIKYLPYYFGLIKGTTSLREQITAATSSIEVDNSTQNAPYSLCTNNLEVNFENGEALKFPDIKINYGEKILLTGDSGTGKSTLLKLLLGIIQPSSGKIKFMDKQGRVVTPDLSKIGYIAQDPVLFPSTIKNNITMFDDKLDGLVKNAVEDVGLAPDIAKFDAGLDTKINLHKLNVSGGQRQKIILARSKIHDSNILLIDEGTSAIDKTATVAILKKLVELPSTIIFIAHNFDERITGLFDREIQLSK